MTPGPPGAGGLPVGTYARRLAAADACLAARLPLLVPRVPPRVPPLAGRALDVGCGVRLARGPDGRLTPFAPTSEELAAAFPALAVTAVDPALPEAAVRVGRAWVALDGAGRAVACLLEAADRGDTVQVERIAHHPDGPRVAAACAAALVPAAEAWWASWGEEASRAGRLAPPVRLGDVPALAALPGVTAEAAPPVELLARPLLRHAEAAGTPLADARAATVEALGAAGIAGGFDLVRVANVTAFLPDGPAAALLRAAALAAREGGWLAEAGTVSLGGEAGLTALALAEKAGGAWVPRELWLSPGGTPAFLARRGAELPAVLGAAGPPAVRALVEADRAVRAAGREPDAATMAAALRLLGRRAWTAPGVSLVGLSVAG